VPWIAQLRDAYERFEAGTPQYRLGLWKKMWDDEGYWRVFGRMEEKHFKWMKEVTEQGAVDRVFRCVLSRATLPHCCPYAQADARCRGFLLHSKSYITALSDDERRALEKDLRAVIHRGEGKRWIDEAAGTFEYDYTTDLYIARRK
jgi:hypothetical protein